MSDFIAVHGGMVASILLAVVCINVALTAIKTILEKIEPTPEQLAASKFYQVVCKVVGVLTKVIDWLSANKEH